MIQDDADASPATSWPANQPAFLDFLKLLDEWNDHALTPRFGVFVIFVKGDEYGQDVSRGASRLHDCSLYLGSADPELLAVIRSTETEGPPLVRYWRDDDEGRAAWARLPKIVVVRIPEES